MPARSAASQVVRHPRTIGRQLNALHFAVAMPKAAIAVIVGPDNLFSLPEVDLLLGEERAHLPLHAARLPAGRALLLQACVTGRSHALDCGHLDAVRVHAEGGLLRGDIVCDPGELPWEDDAFQLVCAQHVGDVLQPSAALLDELARVLAPGGVLLWFGLNPWSPWLVWLHWQARRGVPVPRVLQADIARQRLLKRRLTAGSVDYLGSCWPQRGEPSAMHRSRMLAPLRGAYLIAASKRRAVLTPLRPRRARERVSIHHPQLAGTPSRRASA
jgi:SAM-dependent methyltransferase